MRVVAIIQARLGSTRLPGKVLTDIAGRTMLERVIQRALEIHGVDQVVVAFPYKDIQSTWFLSTADVYAFAWTGDERDVLGRFNAAAREHDADVVMRLTADDPCLDPVLCEDVLRTYLAACSPAAFAHNVAKNTDGWDCEVFSAQLLRYAHLIVTDPYAREHVTPYFHENAHVRFVEVAGDAPKLSVDTLDDLERVRAIYRFVGKDVFSRAETLAACAALEIR